MKQKTKTIIEILIVYLILLAMPALSLVNRLITQDRIFSLLLSMLLYVLILAVVIIPCKIQHKKISEYWGISKQKLLPQICTALIPFAITVSVFVLLPLLLGVDKRMILSAKYTDIGEISLRILFFMVFVGPVEELVFRGYLFGKLKEITQKDFAVCLITALMFGFWHFPSSLSLLNVFCTFVIGLVFAAAKVKLKNCTLLSLCLAHGLHDTVILILSCLLL